MPGSRPRSPSARPARTRSPHLRGLGRMVRDFPSRVCRSTLSRWPPARVRACRAAPGARRRLSWRSGRALPTSWPRTPTRRRRAVIVGREITMSALRELAAARGGAAYSAVAVNTWGKWKTAAQARDLLVCIAEMCLTLVEFSNACGCAAGPAGTERVETHCPPSHASRCRRGALQLRNAAMQASGSCMRRPCMGWSGALGSLTVEPEQIRPRRPGSQQSAPCICGPTLILPPTRR